MAGAGIHGAPRGVRPAQSELDQKAIWVFDTQKQLTAGDAVTYFCFIESGIQSVPHMEPLAADDPHEARLEAEALLAQHASGYIAHVFEGDERVASIRRDDRAGSLSPADQPSA